MYQHLFRAFLLPALLVSMITPGLAADRTSGTLEGDLAGEIATGLIKNKDAAVAAPPSLAAFESLFTTFEQVRKWQAYLDAARAAKLDATSPVFAKVTAAVA